jgi:hypothetical protein
MTKNLTVAETSVPLYLLPRAIAHEINRMGDSVYRISIRRTHWHHYEVSVRVKALPKELAPPASITAPAPAWRVPEDVNGETTPRVECEA